MLRRLNLHSFSLVAFAVLIYLGMMSLSSHCFAQTLVDTVKVGHRAVIVFSYSQQEVDSLERDANSGIDEVLSDFFYYLGEAEPLLDSNAIEIRTSTAKTIIVLQKGRSKPFAYDRSNADPELGVIFLDSAQRPKVLTGILGDHEWRDAITKYFSLKPR